MRPERVANERANLAPVSFEETWDHSLVSVDPLQFPGYHPPGPGEESVRTGVIRLRDRPIALIECRFDHVGGTMGVAAGEMIVRAFDRARERRLPLAAVVASGGARLQEGMLSLIQMGRTVSAVQRYAEAGLMWAAIYTPHTTGGVYASWASLADVRGAEPGAVIGFGGPRVVAEVTGQYPPPTSHTAESAYANGLVDSLVPAADRLDWFAAVLAGDCQPLVLPANRPERPERRSAVLTEPDAWECVLAARAPQRPSGLEWAAWLTDGWIELRGRDRSLRAGLARIDGRQVVVVATDRHALDDAAARPGPAAFRLAQRAIALAHRLSVPILTLIDTPGAEPGPAAEADGVAGEIARTLQAIAAARVPSVALCVGEGGSGGAMALAHADRLLMLSKAVFSVIGPQAGATILYRDAGQAPELAAALGLRAADLVRLGVADGIVEENVLDPVAVVRAAVIDALDSAIIGARDSRAATATGLALVEAPAEL
ncbi:MAG: carboxyl transferase [Pseudonocardiales bacterium]|nr:carboxyl transferase [Pseudonocardiales bacterium]